MLHLEEVEEIADDLHEGEHADRGSDGGDAGAHVLEGGHFLLLDTDEPLQELVSLVHLIG